MESSNLKQSGSGNSKQPKTAIEFIVDQLKERRDLYEKHRQEANAVKQLSAKQSLSMEQWMIERDHRDDQAAALEAFLESTHQVENSTSSNCVVSKTSVTKILQQLRLYSRAQIRFHQKCAKQMNPKDELIKIVLEITETRLEMSKEQFEDNVLASPLAMRIIRRTFANGTTSNQPTQRKATESSNIKQSDSGNNKQPTATIKFIVDQLKERRDLYQKHRQEANAANQLSEKQSLSVAQWAIERNHRINQVSALKAFLESKPHAENSTPSSCVVSKASITKILEPLHLYSRAQIKFHQNCAERMNPNDVFRKIVLETVKEWLEMDQKQFEDNVLASPLAMSIIRRTFDSETSINQLNPSKNHF